MKAKKLVLVGVVVLVHQIVMAVLLKVIEVSGMLDKTSFLETVYLITGLVVIIYGAFIAYKNKRTGEPDDDELTMKIRNKANTYAGALNLFVWLEIYRYAEKADFSKSLLIFGFLISALTFLISYTIVRMTFNENKN